MPPRFDLAFDGLGPFCKRIALVLAALGLITLAPLAFGLLQARLASALLEFLPT